MYLLFFLQYFFKTVILDTIAFYFMEINYFYVQPQEQIVLCGDWLLERSDP